MATRKTAGAGLAAALLVGMLMAVSAEAGGSSKKKEIRGAVAAACAKSGALLKVKTVCPRSGKPVTVTLGVVKKARAQVKALKKGDLVAVTYMQCPKSKKLFALSVKKLKKL